MEVIWRRENWYLKSQRIGKEVHCLLHVVEKFCCEDLEAWAEKPFFMSTMILKDMSNIDMQRQIEKICDILNTRDFFISLQPNHLGHFEILWCRRLRKHHLQPTQHSKQLPILPSLWTDVLLACAVITLVSHTWLVQRSAKKLIWLHTSKLHSKSRFIGARFIFWWRWHSVAMLLGTGFFTTKILRRINAITSEPGKTPLWVTSTPDPPTSRCQELHPSGNRSRLL